MISSKELAVGAWVRTDGEIAKITSLYERNGEPVVDAKLYDDSSDICTDEIMICLRGLEPIPVTVLLLEKNGWVRDDSDANIFRNPKLGKDNKIVFKDNVPVFHGFRYHMCISFRTYCTNTTRISASTCRYSRFSRNRIYFFINLNFRLLPKVDGCGNLTICYF